MLETKPRPESDAEVSSSKVYINDTGSQYHGVWQAAPGRHANLPGQETVFILEGKATVSGTTGDVVDVAAGDIVVIDAGEVATWEVQETIRKFFVVNKQE
ncbi:cupin domain-containing protein [Mycolicibacterium sp. BiH015]|uniref:cupin domain-containing protein n=1 Tax=Mycolicibacterium sp. BiH015 TaxID=3018808 RepID=UPI0022E78E10|nr:cupin domain-containing protein [Mycolicibacterium sp. BiH015]MDA2893333.1 cupin domain-containing protein [Mycolicibacterium sp. BiH015]